MQSEILKKEIEQRFIELNITNQIEDWVKIGEVCHISTILEKEDLLSQNLTYTETADNRYGFIYLQGNTEIDGYVRLAENMQELIGLEKFLTTEEIEKSCHKKVRIILAPGEKYVPREMANPNGESILLNAEAQNRFFTFAHEMVHSILGRYLGLSQSAVAMEGAAVYFSQLRFPSNTNTFDRGYGLYEINFLIEQGLKVGLSHTQLLENALTIPQVREYEYAYRFGGFLTTFIVERYGKETFLNFYKKTCATNMYDSLTGKPLIKDGVKISQEREIINHSLRALGIDVGQLEIAFDAYMKANTPKAG